VTVATDSPLPPRVRWSRTALAVAAWLFAAALLAQIFLAGRAAFGAPGYWIRHKSFVHAFEWLSPLAVLLAYLARASRRAKWMAWLTVLLLLAQYVTAGLPRTPAGQPWAALHPVTGVLLFWAATELARGARPRS